MRRSKRERFRANGYTLIELLVVVVLLSATSTLAAYAFVQSSRATSRANKDMAAVQTFDSMVGLLRRDMWNAQSARVQDGSPLMIRQAGNRVLAWQRLEDGSVTRTEMESKEASATQPALESSAATRTWRNVPAVNFAVKGPVLQLTVADARETTVIDLPSQVMLLGERR